MILVRFVCQAKFGKASDVVAGFKRSNEIARTVVGPNVRVRLLTDLSGAFDTVVQELEVESLAEWERLRAVIFSNPEIQEVEASMPDVIVSGQTEYYTIEAEWR
jgi:ABC-type Na+ transport system ATPase subunit NatA